MITNNTDPRIPDEIDKGRHCESDMDYLWHHYAGFKKLVKQKNEPLLTVESNRYALGFPLPPFQRELKWTRHQEVAFIESAWLGLPLESYTHHALDWDWDREGRAKPYSGWLVDGQQRLTTIERYWEGQFKVFDLYFSELTRSERIRFMRTKFTHYECAIWDEAIIRDLYNRRNLGGTPHTADERA